MSFSFMELPIWARAGMVVACLFASIFIFSTTMLCIYRRGRLTVRDGGAETVSMTSVSEEECTQPEGEGEKEDEEKEKKEEAFKATDDVLEFLNKGRALHSQKSCQTAGSGARIPVPEEARLQQCGSGTSKTGRDAQGYYHWPSQSGDEMGKRETTPWNMV